MSNSLVINLAAIKEAAPIADGVYHVEIVEATPGTSSSDNPKIDLKLKITEGAFGGRTFHDTITFTLEDPTNYAMQKAKELLVLIGFDPNDENAQITSEVFLGEVIAARVKTNLKTKINPTTGEPYKPRPQVSQYLPYGSAQSAQSLLDAAMADEEE